MRWLAANVEQRARLPPRLAAGHLLSRYVGGAGLGLRLAAYFDFDTRLRGCRW